MNASSFSSFPSLRRLLFHLNGFWIAQSCFRCSSVERQKILLQIVLIATHSSFENFHFFFYLTNQPFGRGGGDQNFAQGFSIEIYQLSNHSARHSLNEFKYFKVRKATMLSHPPEFEKRWGAPGVGGFLSLDAKGHVSHRIPEVFLCYF